MKLHDFLFCDDVRNEINNKLSLMGLFNDKIIIQTGSNSSIKFPVLMTLALVLRFQISNKDETPDNFNIEYSINKKSIIKVSGNLSINKNQTSFNITIKGNIPVEPGNLSFTLNLLKKEKVIFTEKKDEAIQICLQQNNFP